MDGELSLMQNRLAEKDTELLRSSFALSQKDAELVDVRRLLRTAEDEGVRVRSQLAVEQARYEQMQRTMDQGCMQAEDVRMRCRALMHGVKPVSHGAARGMVVLEASRYADLQTQLHTLQDTLECEQARLRTLETAHADELLLLYELVEQKEKEILSVLAARMAAR